MGAQEPAAWLQQPPQQGPAAGERRVGHHVERAARQPEVAGVGPHHDRAGEALAQGGGPPGVELDGDDARAGCEQWLGQRARAGAHVEDEIAPTDAGLSDEPCRFLPVQPVPAPPAPWPGHGGAPSA